MKQYQTYRFSASRVLLKTKYLNNLYALRDFALRNHKELNLNIKIINIYLQRLVTE